MLVRRIDRYLMSEISGPLALGFLVYTFILLLRFLFRSAEMIIRQGLDWGTVGTLLVLSLPNIVVLTIPMALLFAILIAVGRLAADSELTALRSTGVSLLTLYRPILFTSGLLTLLNVALMVWALPWGNSGLQQLVLGLDAQSAAKQVQARVFYEDWEGLVVYVFEVEPDSDRWEGVFISESLPSAVNQVTVAERGRVEVDEAGERVVLALENAVTHKSDRNDPESYEITRNGTLRLVIDESFATSRQESVSMSRSLRSMSLPELFGKIEDPESTPETVNRAWVEVHKKFAIPAACLVFGLFALPLGFNNRRGGKASGFALSILVILVYYILLSNGEEAATFGKLPPWLAMWGANILLGAAGFLLLLRKNRDKSLLLSRVDQWIRHDVWSRILHLKSRREEKREARRRAARERSTEENGEDGPSPAAGRQPPPQVVLRVPRPRLVFPNLLDRYVMRVFLMVLAITVLAGVSIYIVADLSDTMDDIMENQVDRGLVVDYYKYMSLQIFFDVSPVLVLVTTLITFGLLARSNEVTAAKALGVSLYRLAVPAVVMAALVSLLSAGLEAEVLPASNARVAQIKDHIKGRETVRTYRRADRQWLFGHGRYIYNYLYYDPNDHRLQQLQVFEFDEQHRLDRRLFANTALYAGGGEGWIFEDGWVRTFEAASVGSYERFEEPVLVDYPETPEYFDSEVLPPDQMHYGELERHIEELEESGQRVPELRVQLMRKLSTPVLSLVMALVALPFAFRLGRQGALYGLGIAVVLGMVLMGVYAFFTTLGETEALPPLVAVWAPNVLFSMLALYLFLGVRS